MDQARKNALGVVSRREFEALRASLAAAPDLQTSLVPAFEVAEAAEREARLRDVFAGPEYGGEKVERYFRELTGWSMPERSAPLSVTIVGCCGPKLDRPAPARDLYVSPLFLAARAYAEALGGPWVIVSAAHGILMPYYEVEPYDETMSSALNRYLGDSKGERRATFRAWWKQDWAKRQQATLRRRFGAVYDTRYVYLAGAAYRGCVSDIPRRVATPLEGLGIGDRVAWLRRETEALKRAGAAA